MAHLDHTTFISSTVHKLCTFVCISEGNSHQMPVGKRETLLGIDNKVRLRVWRCSGLVTLHKSSYLYQLIAELREPVSLNVRSKCMPNAGSAIAGPARKCGEAQAWLHGTAVNPRGRR